MPAHNKSGPSRRMQKQGMPAPLDEAKVTRKRKDAPAAPQVVASEGAGNKKRKRGGLSIANGKVNGGKVALMSGALGHKTSNGVQTTLGASRKRIGNLTIRKEQLLDAEDDEEVQEEEEGGSSDSMDGISDSDVMDDESDLDDAGDLAEDSDLGMESYDEFDDDSDVVDSDQEMGNGGIWSDDDSDAAETLNAANLEGMSRHLDAKAAKEATDAQAELEEAAIQTNIAGDELATFDDDSDEGSRVKTRLAPDLQLLRTRITDTVRILDPSTTSTEPLTRSRKEYIQQLLKDMCAYYGYSFFLAEKLFNLFTPKEAFSFFEANETPRPVVIRTNTLRTHRRELAQKLVNRGVTLEPVGKWSKVGLQVFESNVPLGATPEYLAGHYIIQAASSFLPVMALAPQEHERILDMASAPGGKTTYMAALMKNTGCVFANDSNKERAKALIGNTHRLGVKNTIICNHDARDFPKVVGGFDRVLLDAPCSGTGVISKDASVKTNKTEKDFLRLPHLQKQLILAAIDSVDHTSKTGGYIVYSTCSVTVEENEQVIQYALSRRPNVRVVETGLVFGREGFVNYMGKKFDPSLKMSRRYYPHEYNVDGFFVCKLKKTGKSPAASSGSLSAGPATDAMQIDSTSKEKTARPGSTSDVIPDDSNVEEEEDDFGGWDEEEDAEIINRSKRAALRRKGLNPKILNGAKPKNGIDKGSKSKS